LLCDNRSERRSLRSRCAPGTVSMHKRRSLDVMLHVRPTGLPESESSKSGDESTGLKWRDRSCRHKKAAVSRHGRCSSQGPTLLSLADEVIE
jgi:hypothetical protein